MGDSEVLKEEHFDFATACFGEVEEKNRFSHKSSGLGTSLEGGTSS